MGKRLKNRTKRRGPSSTICPKWEDYKECMIAFIDVLGFDQKVRKIKSKEDFYGVARLVSILRNMGKKYQNRYNKLFKNLEITNFSDSIIFSMPYTDPLCAMGLIIWMCARQYELISSGSETLVRGYLTKGPIYHKNKIIFGGGFNDAYQNEKKSGCGYAPRIVIDPKIIQEGQEGIINYVGEEPQDHIFNYLIEDTNDGSYIIDYLKPVWSDLPTWSNKKLFSERAEIKRVIDKNLELFQNDQKIYMKYQWLEKYFSFSENYFKDLKNFYPEYMPTITGQEKKIIPNQIPPLIDPGPAVATSSHGQCRKSLGS